MIRFSVEVGRLELARRLKWCLVAAVLPA